MVLAAVGTYLVAFRFYSRFLADRVFGLNDRRATPAERLANGRDFVPTNRWVLLGHHFAAIAGAGPLVGPVLAAQFGFLPGTLWIIIGVVLAGAVQDFIILFASMRRSGKSLGQMTKEEISPFGRWVAGNATLGPLMTWGPITLVFVMMAYGFIASVLPVWVLLCPRDYLSTFMKVGTILLLAIATVLLAPTLQAPRVN